MDQQQALQLLKAMAPGEAWAPVTLAPSEYVATSLGRIFSLKRRTIRKVGAVSDGYKVVHLYAAGSTRKCYVHRLVLQAFVGPTPSADHYALHGDGDSLNNDLSNLRWGVQSENMADAKRHGTMPSGGSSGRALLTEAEVVAIVKAYQEGHSMRDLGVQYGVHKSTISAILTGRSWRDVTGFTPKKRAKRRYNKSADAAPTIRLLGTSHPASKLSEQDVREIRMRRDAGETGVALGGEFGVTSQMIYRICAGKAWTHVE